MALTAAERQKQRRARVKAMARSAPDRSAEEVRGSFAEFIQRDQEAQFAMSFMRETFDSVGMHCPEFETEADPYWREEWQAPNKGALGLATRAVGAWIDCAKQLAETVNRFKLAEIEAAISELETKKITSLKAQKEALSRIVKLQAIKVRLEREVRHPFHPTEVKGE